MLALVPALALHSLPWAGFWVELEGATLFAPEAAYLLKYAQTARPKGRVFVYSWGVSQRP